MVVAAKVKWGNQPQTLSLSQGLTLPTIDNGLIYEI